MLSRHNNAGITHSQQRQGICHTQSYHTKHQHTLKKTKPPFKKIWSDLSVADNGLILLRAGRIVMPTSKTKDILRSLHSSHAGVTRTMKLAQQLYYWPGMTEHIKDMISECRLCQELRPSETRNPPKKTPIAETGPMQHMGRTYSQ